MPCELKETVSDQMVDSDNLNLLTTYKEAFKALLAQFIRYLFFI